MRNWLNKLQPSPWLTRKLMMLAIVVSVGVAAFLIGRKQSAQATPPDSTKFSSMSNADIDQYNRRVVAYVYDNIPVTRAELGEYLIARFGGERLEFLVNRKIVEMECRKYNIFATDEEVELRFRQDLNSFGTPLTPQDFVNNILRRFGKTLYEWKEDVIRPKIMMEKLVRSKVQIVDKDLQEGFEARYGPKVECRMIVLDTKTGIKAITDVWNNASKGRKEFLDEAGKQSIPNLQASGGKVPPIHKHFGDKDLEETAFRLKEGEVSRLITMPDGSYVILYCEKHLLADANVRFENERIKLSKEMFDLRLAQKIPQEFAAIRERAKPRLILVNDGQHATFAVPPVPTHSTSTVSEPMPPLKELTPMAPLPPVPTPGYNPLSVPNAPLAPLEIAPPATTPTPIPAPVPVTK